MNRAIVLLIILLASASAQETLPATSPHGESPRPLRPVHTFSIVARDPQTGEMGVAVQSHWFSVGSIVPWAEAGVGAVATQSFVDPSYGPLGLEAMRAGPSAPAATFAGASRLLSSWSRQSRAASRGKTASSTSA